MVKKTLPIGTYQYTNEQASSRKLVNCTAEAAPADSSDTIVLRRMPGVVNFTTTGTAIRGQQFFQGELFVVSGTSLLKVTSAGVVSTIGVIPGSDLVSMSNNGFDLVIVTNPLAFSSDGTTVSQITDSVFLDFGGASDVDFLDGFLIFTVPDSRVSFVSGLNALTFNALDFTTIDGSTDNLLGLIVDHREIIYLKEKTSEIWYNAGNSVGFPMSRSPGGYLEIGCISAATAAKIGGSVYWLANDGTVRQLSGATPSIISSIGIAKFIKDGADAYGFAYTFEDKHYYVLSLPGVTLEYDILAQEWHNRETFTKSIWDVLAIEKGYGKTLVFNILTGEIGDLSTAEREEWGEIQRIQWTYQQIEGDGRRVAHNRLEISMATGVGIATGQGSDPKLELEISDGGGGSFYSFETISIGKQGDVFDRVVFSKLGSSYKRVYRVTMTDPVDLLTFDTNLELTGGGF